VRIFIVDTCYPAFLAAHYESQSGLAEESYIRQWRSLMDTFFGTADSYSHHLRAQGHDAHEVVANCPQLQLRWAAEHDLELGSNSRRSRRASWQDEIVLAQAADFRPDVVYVQNQLAVSRETLRRLRGSGAAIVGQIATEPPAAKLLRQFDLMVTACPHFVSAFRGKGIRCEYLPLAFDARILTQLESEAPVENSYETVFVGSLKRFRRWRSNHVIEHAARSVPVTFWGYGASQWPRSSPIRQNYMGNAWGMDMFRVLRSAKVALNRHGDTAGDYACNMRLYEATGVGALLLTDSKLNLGELFSVGTEIVSYEDEHDLVRKVRHFTAHEEERRAIAAAGQARTLREHTYDTRMSELVAILERTL
jgi:spore maturation protein CgeB